MFRLHLLEIGAKHHLSILNSLTHTHTQAFAFSLSLLHTHTLINTHTHTHKHTHTHSISHIIYLSLPYVIVFFFHSLLLLDFPLKQDLVTPIQIQTHIPSFNTPNPWLQYIKTLISQSQLYITNMKQLGIFNNIQHFQLLFRLTYSALLINN